MTAKRKTYREWLLDPRWQKRRLECLEAAGFRCQRCRHTDKTLQVHHRRYYAGRKPWEYTDAQLIVLCDDCHELQHLPAATEEDAQRERTIDRLHKELLATTDPAERRQIMLAMAGMVGRRSPQQVKRIERDRGLR